MKLIRAPFLACAVFALGCTGSIDTGAASPPDEPMNANGGAGGAAANNPKVPALRSALRRLTANEMRNTMIDLVGVDPADFMYGWPQESTPLDNNYFIQTPSDVLTQSAGTIADRVARIVATDRALLQKAGVTCAAADQITAPCLEAFIKSFGQRAFRRPLTTDEASSLQALVLARNKTVIDAIEMVLRILLQSPEFLYRVECGGCMNRDIPVPDDETSIRLTSWEMASRLSYLLSGSMPDQPLFDAATRDGLQSAADLRTQARRLMTTAAGHNRIGRFHAMWLGYEWAALKYPKQMRGETDALLKRVIFDKKTSWFDVFKSTETYIDSVLASHYGDGIVKNGAGSSWVGYGKSQRRGILSHGSFLSVAAAPADTSTTKRGKYIREQLLCQTIPPPPPPAELKRLNGGKEIDTSKPPDPSSGECRIAHIQQVYLGNPGCAGCHNQMDPTGFGLEAYDKTGKYRTSEPNRPGCPTTGRGQLLVSDGAGTALKDFQGPAGLSDLLTQGAAQKSLGDCLARQFFRFAAGRQEGQAGDEGLIAALIEGFESHKTDFQELVLAYVSAPEFGYRLPHALAEGK